MLIVILLAGAVLVMMMFVLRNALTVSVAGAGAGATWMATHDLPATCAAMFASLFLASLLLELGAASRSGIVRGVMLGAETLVAAAVAATFALMLFQEWQSAQATSLTMLCAALLGAGAALSNRAKQH